MPARKTVRSLIPLAAAIVLASTPAGLDLSAGHGVRWLVAFAEKGGSSGGGGGSGGGSSGSGHGSSGSSSGGDGGSSGGRGGGSSNSGSGTSHGGSQGASGGGGVDDKHARADERADRRDDHPGRAGSETRSGRASVAVNGSNIEVTTEDGFRQRIEGSRFEMKDPMGRTIVRRSATAKDRARLSTYR